MQNAFSYSDSKKVFGRRNRHAAVGITKAYGQD